MFGGSRGGGLVFTSVRSIAWLLGTWQAKLLYESESSDLRTTCVSGGCDGLSVIVAPGG